MYPSTARAPGRFRRDTNATTAIEFALLLPIWLWMTFEVLQIGLYFFYSASLVRATDAAARQILTGSVASQGLTQTQFLNTILAPQLPGNMSISNVVANIQVFPSSTANAYASLTNDPTGVNPTSLNAVPMDNTKTSFCLGSKGSLVAVQVFYAMPVLGIPALGLTGGATFNGQHVVWISATAAFENEPFPASSESC
jgi:Flp pilus assembly protein TadG